MTEAPRKLSEQRMKTDTLFMSADAVRADLIEYSDPDKWDQDDRRPKNYLSLLNAQQEFLQGLSENPTIAKSE